MATNTSNGEGTKTYIGPVYLHYSCIKVYKRNSTENLLLQHILYIIIYASLLYNI